VGTCGRVLFSAAQAMCVLLFLVLLPSTSLFPFFSSLLRAHGLGNGMDLVIIGLDMTSIAILCYKCIVWKSARGLSWDMFVCIAIAAVLFVMPNLEFLFLNDISPSFIVMVICAFAIVVSFPFLSY